MHLLWGGMILIGITFAAFTGNMQGITEAVLLSSREAVELCITMAGITALWTGVLKIAERSGLVDALARRMRFFMKLLFPGLKTEERALGYISSNFLANMLGLSWASTATGLKAFHELDRINKERCERWGESKYMATDLASREMCTFLILNVSSLQLLPMSVLTYRSQYGSANPAAIVGPSLIATGCSTLAAIGFCIWMNRKPLI